jgi:hypothetical protein
MMRGCEKPEMGKTIAGAVEKSILIREFQKLL